MEKDSELLGRIVEGINIESCFETILVGLISQTRKKKKKKKIL
jgi:hypothetical protein